MYIEGILDGSRNRWIAVLSEAMMLYLVMMIWTPTRRGWWIGSGLPLLVNQHRRMPRNVPYTSILPAFQHSMFQPGS